MNTSPKIHIERLDTVRSFVMLLLSTGVLLTGYLVDGSWSKFLLLMGYVMMSIYFARPLFYKNYLGHNKMGFQLRIAGNGLSSMLFDRFMYKRLMSVHIEGDQLILKERAKTKSLDISHIDAADRQKIMNIISR